MDEEVASDKSRGAAARTELDFDQTSRSGTRSFPGRLPRTKSFSLEAGREDNSTAGSALVLWCQDFARQSQKGSTPGARGCMPGMVQGRVHDSMSIGSRVERSLCALQGPGNDVLLQRLAVWKFRVDRSRVGGTANCLTNGKSFPRYEHFHRNSL